MIKNHPIQNNKGVNPPCLMPIRVKLVTLLTRCFSESWKKIKIFSERDSLLIWLNVHETFTKLSYAYKSWKNILEKWMFLQKGFQPILVSLKSLLWLPNFWEKSSLLPKVERWQDERSAENYNGLPHSTDISFLRSCYLVGFNKNFLSCSNLWKCKGFLWLQIF